VKLRAAASLGLLAGLSGLLAGFSWMPVSHGVRPPAKGYALSRPWYVADAERLVDARALEFNATETASPVLDAAQTRLYVTLRDGRLLCRFRGVTAWTWTTPGSLLAAPLIEESTDTLYVAAATGTLTALNRITGAVRWATPLKEELTTTPFLSDGKLFVMSSDESITALESSTGKTLWKFHRDRPGGFTIRGNARPVVAHGLVFAGFADGTVAALRVADGVARWTRNPSGPGDYLDVDEIAAPETDSRIYVASAKSGVSALEVASGEITWTRDLLGANHVVVDGPRLYATGRGAVVGLARRDGTQLWKAMLQKERFATEPVAIGGLLLFAEDRGSLIALDPASGIARAVLDPGSGFSQTIAAVEGAAFILSNNGTLFSIGLLP
jgi:outer membrane protein assembly factor BamB